MNHGWISLHRKILDNPIVCKNSDYFSVWCYLLLNATHKEQDKIFKNERITLKKGQLITGRKAIASQFNISESKVQRILKKLEIEQQIEQQTGNKNRLISIVRWIDYQCNEQQIEQQVNNNRTTSEQQVNTNNNVNKANKGNNETKEICSFFESMWKLYPNKKGKGQIKDACKKKLYKLDDEFKRCIERYIKDTNTRRKEFAGLKYQNGSTFFNSGYVDYLDKNYQEVKSGYNGANQEDESVKGYNPDDFFREREERKARERLEQ